MISVERFLTFPNLTCHLEDKGIGVFWLHAALGSSNQEASPPACKNTRVVLMPYCAWKSVPTAISGGVDISEVPGCCLLRHEFSVRVTKTTSRAGVS